MKTAEINEEFNQILKELKKKDDLPIESIVQVAQVILQESGKDRRTELLREARLSNNEFNSSSQNSKANDVKPATYRQKNALNRFGIEYSDDITKSEAYELLEKAFEQLDSKNREE